MTEITYCNHSIHLKLLTDGEVGIGGDRWPAANKFCELVSNKKLQNYFSQLFNTKRILDLGSGTGLTSLVIDKLYQPLEILVTDQASHMELIEKNLILNETKYCKAQTYDWVDRTNIGTFGVILALEW